METIIAILDVITHFIFNWNTYFWCIPIYCLLFTFLIKKTDGRVQLDDVPSIIIFGIVNPIWSLLIAFFILYSPFLFLMAYIMFGIPDRIKGKKIL